MREVKRRTFGLARDLCGALAEKEQEIIKLGKKPLKHGTGGLSDMDIERMKELIAQENSVLWDYKEELIELVEKATPKKPCMDMWFRCPLCGYEDDDFEDLLGFEPDPRPGHPDMEMWVGPSFCRKCGQSLDMSELNEED